jgi:hypothetical protein
VEESQHHLPFLDLVLLDMDSPDETQGPQVCEQSGFKIVCTNCGGLSIMLADPVDSPGGTHVLCRRCGAVRGSLAELHALARSGRDSFEF